MHTWFLHQLTIMMSTMDLTINTLPLFILIWVVLYLFLFSSQLSSFESQNRESQADYHRAWIRELNKRSPRNSRVQKQNLVLFKFYNTIEELQPLWEQIRLKPVRGVDHEERHELLHYFYRTKRLLWEPLRAEENHSWLLGSCYFWVEKNRFDHKSKWSAE